MNVSADASSGTACSPDNLRQEIRLAVVMTGGISLAIWMGGVARELNLLLDSGNTASPPARQVQGCYQSLRDLLSVPACCPGLQRAESMRPSWAWRMSRIANAFKQTALVTIAALEGAGIIPPRPNRA